MLVVMMMRVRAVLVEVDLLLRKVLPLRTHRVRLDEVALIVDRPDLEVEGRRGAGPRVHGPLGADGQESDG